MKRKALYCFLSFLLGAVLFCAFCVNFGATGDVSDDELLKRAAIVRIKYGDKFLPVGSSVIINDRYVLTCRHVADPYEMERKAIKIGELKKWNLEIPKITEGEIFLPHLGIRRSYTVLAYHDDEYVDLALLLLNEPIAHIKSFLKITENIKEGEIVRIAGFPGAVALPEVRSGIVKYAKFGLMVYSNAQVEKGMSGSGNYNFKGELVGILRGSNKKFGYDATSEGANFIFELLQKNKVKIK